MRLMLPTAVLVFASACGTLSGPSTEWAEDTAFLYDSDTIYAATRGVAVSDNGAHGAAGMGGAACEVQSDWMGIGADYLDGEDPRVVDGRGDDFLVLTEERVYVFHGSVGAMEAVSAGEMGEVVAGALRPSGATVVLEDTAAGCQVLVFDEGTVGSASVEPGLCMGSPDLSVGVGLGVVSTDDGTWTVEVRSGHSMLLGQEDRHALQSRHVLLASSGASEVRLVSLETGEVQVAAVDGRVIDITSLDGGFALLTTHGTEQFVDVLSVSGEWGHRTDVEGLFTSISGARDAQVALVVAPTHFTKVQF
jgi:hypothetical protein